MFVPIVFFFVEWWSRSFLVLFCDCWCTFHICHATPRCNAIERCQSFLDASFVFRKLWCCMARREEIKEAGPLLL